MNAYTTAVQQNRSEKSTNDFCYWIAQSGACEPTRVVFLVKNSEAVCLQSGKIRPLSPSPQLPPT